MRQKTDHKNFLSESASHLTISRFAMPRIYCHDLTMLHAHRRSDGAALGVNFAKQKKGHVLFRFPFAACQPFVFRSARAEQRVKLRAFMLRLD